MVVWEVVFKGICRLDMRVVLRCVSGGFRVVFNPSLVGR